MKVLVGVNEDYFFAYDVSTFNKLKSVYLEEINQQIKYKESNLKYCDNKSREWRVEEIDMLKERKDQALKAKTEEEIEDIVSELEEYDINLFTYPGYWGFADLT